MTDPAALKLGQSQPVFDPVDRAAYLALAREQAQGFPRAWLGLSSSARRESPVWTLSRTGHRRAATYLALVVALALGGVLLGDVTWQGSAQLHTLMEVIAALLALFVGVVAMVRFYSRKSNTFFLIGSGFLGTFLLDGYHGVLTSTFVADQFASAPPSLLPWSWISSRLLLSLLLLSSWLTWKRESATGRSWRVSEPGVYVVVGALTLASVGLLTFVSLPRAFYPGFLVPRPAELVPAALFLVALIGYLRKGHWKYVDFEHWLVLSLIVGVMGQSLFMAASERLFDAMFFGAHLLKQLSYVLVLTGLLNSTYYLFRWAEDSAKAIMRANEALEREIIERMRVDDALAEQATELARSNAELEQFAYVASHDLQEPLRMVASYTQLLARRYRGKLDADADEFIGYAVDGATRMRRLVHDLLAYSRVGRHGQAMAPTDCDAVFAAARTNLRAAIEESGAVVTADSLPKVLANETQLVQVFQNLIGNAIKFRAGRPLGVHIGATRQGSHWLFSVRDDGSGIDPEFAPRVFMIFQRLHARTDCPGTGIGLAVCKKVVESHGGRIWVESEPNKGSTFYFTLPTIEGSRS
ncbi:MAG: ATP-binding protein [Candidatus Methylomirabilia bacterium]